MSWTAPPADIPAVAGRTDGRVITKTIATRYRNATVRISTSGPARLTTSGPSRANPRAKATFWVNVNRPFAASSWRRGTSTGIIAASAGAKNVVTVEIAMFRTKIADDVAAGQEDEAEEDRPGAGS